MKKYQFYNLAQKMIKIRKSIPKLVKKRYSEDVDYDFVKIDDIYNFLTPALNKYGVDFEIAEERETVRDANGNMVFLKEENGLWRYEANLTIRWINADNPSEESRASIHVIGTHDVPEKAKGTAWTYGLKYYFLNKFNINQGGDDSDLMNCHPVPDKEEEIAGKKETVKKGTEKKMAAARQEAAEKHAETRQKVEEKPTASKQEMAEEPAPVRQEVGEKPKEKAKKEPGKQEKDAAMQEGQITFVPSEPEKKTAEANIADMGEAEAEGLPDGFIPADDDEIPFFDSDDIGKEPESDSEFLSNLRDEIESEQAADGMTLEEAEKVVCNFGIFSGKTLGEMSNSGKKGLEGIRWIVNDYRGGETNMKEAAKIVWDHRNTGTMAA